MRVDELRGALVEQADRVNGLSARERLAAVDRRVAVSRRRHRASVALAVSLASVAAVAGLVVVRSLGSGGTDGVMPLPVLPSRSSENLVQLPPRLLGRQLPPTLRVNDVDYEYYRSEASPAGRVLLRVAVPGDRQPQALAWVSPANLSGQVVVSVDGQVVSRSAAGTFGSGLLISARRPHLVVVRATRPDVSTRLVLAIYRWPQP
jgi:hypothetical protein